MKSSRQNREQQIQQRGLNRRLSITHTVFVSHPSSKLGTRLSSEVWHGFWLHVLLGGSAPHLHKQTVFAFHFISWYPVWTVVVYVELFDLFVIFPYQRNVSRWWMGKEQSFSNLTHWVLCRLPSWTTELTTLTTGMTLTRNSDNLLFGHNIKYWKCSYWVIIYSDIAHKLTVFSYIKPYWRATAGNNFNITSGTNNTNRSWT